MLERRCCLKTEDLSSTREPAAPAVQHSNNDKKPVLDPNEALNDPAFDDVAPAAEG